MSSSSFNSIRKALTAQRNNCIRVSSFLSHQKPTFATPSTRFLSSEAMSKYQFLKLEEIKPFVYSVQLNRPEKMNALNKILWNEIGVAFRELGDDPDCRVIIMSGNGKLFCSGIDLGDLANLASVVQSEEDAARKSRKIYPLIKEYQNAFLEIEKCPKPVIMAIHSACVGGATNMVCFGDIRYCTKDAWFQVKETALGFAADVGVLQHFPKILNNQSLMRELCFTARKIPSDEAEKCGLVSRVFEDKESMMTAALALADTIGHMSPCGVQNTKLNLNYARDHTLEDSLDFAARINMVMIQSEDVMKAAMAHMMKSKEPPPFAKL